ncbi:hypothetical protein DPMN_159051 [Dreissena polymorpha]|uniref:Uncharacterized protein n=1 Tax=Dreissena polymorpha TaxID=45954 RepID=A0A9D4EK19_DREPO|nr:hypothetical protein DPMN_159051 [Dreissena polymorpha]
MATESFSCGWIDFLTRCFYHPSQNLLTVQACFEHCLSEGRRRTRAKQSDSKAKWDQTVAKQGKEAAALELIFNEIKITDDFLEAMKKFGFQICEVIKEFINDAEILTELPCILDAYLQLNKTLNMTITNNGSAKDMFIVLKKEQFLYNSIQRQKPVLTDDLIAAKNELMMLISDKYQRTQSRQETISRLQPTPENIPKFQGSIDECFHHRTQSLKIYCTSAEKGGLCCDKCLTEEHRDCHEDAHVIIEKEANKLILTMDVQYETELIQTFAKKVPAIDELCSKERNTTLDSIHTMMTIGSEIDRVIVEYERDFAALKTLRDKLTQCAEFYNDIGTEWKMCTGKDSSADFICLQSEDFFLNWSLSFLLTIDVTEMKRGCFTARYEWWTFAYDQYKRHQQKKINPNDDGSNTSEGDKPCAKQVKPLPGRPSYEHYKESGNTQERNADEQVQQQMQIEKTRQTEASKQMLYCVFGNFVSILEELELRIEKGDIKMPRSKIYLADQSYKSVEDVSY